MAGTTSAQQVQQALSRYKKHSAITTSTQQVKQALSRYNKHSAVTKSTQQVQHTLSRYNKHSAGTTSTQQVQKALSRYNNRSASKTIAKQVQQTLRLCSGRSSVAARHTKLQPSKCSVVGIDNSRCSGFAAALNSLGKSPEMSAHTHELQRIRFLRGHFLRWEKEYLFSS
jgi:hypothetical protein